MPHASQFERHLDHVVVDGTGVIPVIGLDIDDILDKGGVDRRHLADNRDLADLVPGPFLESERDEELFAVGSQFGDGRHHPEVGVALGEVVAPKQFLIECQTVRIVGVINREEAIPGAFDRENHLAQRAVREGFVADEDDLANDCLLAFGYLEDEIHPVLFLLDDLGLDNGIEAPDTTIDLGDPGNVRLHLGQGEDCARSQLDLRLEILRIKSEIPLEGDPVDDRILDHLDDQPGTVPADGYVGKEPCIEEILDGIVDFVEVIGVSDADGHVVGDSRRFDPLVSGDDNLRDDLLGMEVQGEKIPRIKGMAAIKRLSDAIDPFLPGSRSQFAKHVKQPQPEQVVECHEQEQRPHEPDTDKLAHLLGTRTQRPPEQDFECIEHEVAAVEKRNREEVDEPQIDGQDGHEEDEAGHAQLGKSGRHMSDAERSRQVATALRAFKDLAKEVKDPKAPSPGLAGAFPQRLDRPETLDNDVGGRQHDSQTSRFALVAESVVLHDDVRCNDKVYRFTVAQHIEHERDARIRGYDELEILEGLDRRAVDGGDEVACLHAASFCSTSLNDLAGPGSVWFCPTTKNSPAKRTIDRMKLASGPASTMAKRCPTDFVWNETACSSRESCALSLSGAPWPNILT